MASGIGSVLVRALGADAVRIRPAVSSVALARARMGWSAEESVVVTLVGRHEARLLREVAPGRRLLLLTSGETTPGVVAELLVGRQRRRGADGARRPGRDRESLVPAAPRVAGRPGGRGAAP